MKLIQYVEKKNIYLVYSISFFLILLIGLLPIELRNGQPLFSGVFVHMDTWLDGLKQHIFFLYDFVREVKMFVLQGDPISWYRFDIGMGESFVSAYGYYSLFDPMTLIAYLIPLDYIEISYTLMIMTRLFISGIFMIWVLKYINIKKNSHILLGTLFYVFSYTALFSAFRHPMFTNGVMYLPLLYYGMRKVLDFKSPNVLILAVFLSVISQFYFAFYSLIGIEVYICIKAILDKEIKTFIRVNLYVFVGVMMASMVLIPQAFSVLGGSRVSSKGFSLFDPLYYGFLLVSLAIPIGSVSAYTIVIENVFVLGVVLLYMRKKQYKDVYSIIVLGGIVFVMIPLFGYALNLFSYANNRWSYIIDFYAVIMFVKYLNQYQRMEKEDTVFLGKVLVSMALFGLLFFAAQPIYLIVRSRMMYSVVLELSVVMIGYYLVKRYVIPFQWNGFVISFNKRFGLFFLGSVLFTVFSVAVLYLFMLSGPNAFSTYYQDEHQYDMINDLPIYRVEQFSYEVGIPSFSNDGIFYGYPSTGLYNTMTNGYVIRAMDMFDVNNENNTVGYNGFDSRYGLLKLNYVKYLFVRESESVSIPLGYVEIDRISVPKYDVSVPVSSSTERYLYIDGILQYEDLVIYEDQNALQFGVLYDSYMTEDQVLSYDGVMLEQLLYQTVILQEELPVASNIRIEPQLDKIILEEDGLFDQGTSYEYTIEGPIDGQVVLYVEGLMHEDPFEGYHVTIQSEEVDSRIVYYSYAGNMYVEEDSYVINLGYYENQESLTFTLEFSKEREYTFHELSYYIIPNEMLEAYHDLDDQVLDHVVFNETGFQADILPDKTGILYLPIVYNEGFTAFVDGEEVDIMIANGGMSAIYIDHNSSISFVYETPGQIIGLYASSLAFGTWIGINGFMIFRRKQHEKN